MYCNVISLSTYPEKERGYTACRELISYPGAYAPRESQPAAPSAGGRECPVHNSLFYHTYLTERHISFFLGWGSFFDSVGEWYFGYNMARFAEK
jgi:hypothetical protein